MVGQRSGYFIMNSEKVCFRHFDSVLITIRHINGLFGGFLICYIGNKLQILWVSGVFFVFVF